MLTLIDTHGCIEVCGNEQFELGRDLDCRYSWHDDSTISRKHLRVHCILYEQDPCSEIAPFVYATDLSTNGTFLKKSNSECTSSQGEGVLMGKNGTFLLDHGDELRLSETVTLIYRSARQINQTVLTLTQEREKATLASRYLITGRLLGEGTYGKVLIGVDQSTQRQLACKMIDLEKIYDRRTLASLRMSTNISQWTSSQAISQLPAKIQSCFREFDILKSLSHPNIVHMQKVFWSQSTIYMFQELVTGGDLFSYIEYKQGRISSIESAVIIRQVLKGVQYLHDRDIVHRDLKPDNILMTSLDSGARVIITDFGHARFLPGASTQHDIGSNKLKRMFSTVGTLEYAAPEIHKANNAIPGDYGYSLSVDMWAIGSITAVILTGEQIFSCRKDGNSRDDAQRVINLAAQCDLSIIDDKHHPLWGSLGPAPKSFIKRLLVLDEEHRMTATEALNHVWFTHPYMAAEFNAEYERAIRDWWPCHKDDNLIEHVTISSPKYTADELSIRKRADAIVSFLLPGRHPPIREDRPNECSHIDESHQCGQFASQPAPLSQNMSYIDNEGRPYNKINGNARFDDDYDVPSDQIRAEEQMHNELDSVNLPKIQSEGSLRPKKVAMGQLQRVSTSTWGKYFEREIVDLDDLHDPSDKFEDATVTRHASLSKPSGAQSQQQLHREATVQVQATPLTIGEDHYGADQWWRDRYPPTQHYYDTQAEPVTQQEDSILVHETPLETFAKSVQPEAQHKLTSGRAFEQQSVYPRAGDGLFVNNTSKRRKMYGRQR